MGLNGDTLSYSTLTLGGFNLGVGYKQMISQSIYLLGEFNFSSFSTKTANVTNTTGHAISAPVGATGTDILVGIGYRF